MSCCIGIKTDNELFIAVDGRTSFSYMGVKYRVTEDDKKYTIHQNKLVVVFGNSDVVDLFIHECDKNEEKDIDTILSIAIPKERIGHVGVNKVFNADGTWDFSSADVKGITATFA